MKQVCVITSEIIGKRRGWEDGTGMLSMILLEKNGYRVPVRLSTNLFIQPPKTERERMIDVMHLCIKGIEIIQLQNYSTIYSVFQTYAKEHLISVLQMGNSGVRSRKNQASSPAYASHGDCYPQLS